MTAPPPEKCDVCGASPLHLVLYPVELQELPRAQIGGERREQVRAAERQPEERPRARELAQRRLHHLLLVLAARDVGGGRVEPVLADARVDERLMPAEVLHALVEAPA